MAVKSNNLADKSGLVDSMVHELATKGSVRLVHFGHFQIKTISGHKRYAFKERKVIEQKPYKQIIFTPARGIREMLRKGKMTAAKSG